ncbi:MAG: transglycosylase SLT domain-containing protein [Chlorobiales bacterium]|nr:transglycosylase SLT domain-containing protein [Chlorobiales bacterium]
MKIRVYNKCIINNSCECFDDKASTLTAGRRDVQRVFRNFQGILKAFVLLFIFQSLSLPVFAEESVTAIRGSLPKSSVSDILDSLVNATYFKDEHFSTSSKESEKFGFPAHFVPQYSDSVYASRIATLARKTPFNLVYNEHVKGFIRIYAVDKRNMTAKILGLTKIYFPLFEEKLDAYNIPLEMKYLAIVESALNPTAVSPAGAKGLWQFMYGTGKMYGMQSSSFIEDRYDSEKATVAACRYLRDLHRIYGDWFLVLAAYNSGPGNVNKAIRRAGGVKNYWAIWNYLPAETRGYIPAFIAVNYIMNFYNEHNIRPVEPGFLYHDIDTLRTTRVLSFDQINETIGVPIRDLKFLNPQYKLGIVPVAGVSGNVIRLPRQYISQFQKREQEIYAYKSPKSLEREQLLAKVESLNAGSGTQGAEGQTEKFHIVQEGENLGTIARLYRTYISQLIVWNNLKDPEVTPGQKLIVFGKTENSSSSQSKMSKTSSVKTKIIRHRVGRGESLEAIARKYDTTVQRLAELNHLNRRRSIVSGQHLKIERETSIDEPSSSSRRPHGVKIRESRSSSRHSKVVKSHKGKKEKTSHSSRKRKR